MSRFAYLQDMLSSLVERYTDNSPRDDDRPTKELCDALLSGRGELSGNHTSLSVLHRLDQLDGSDDKAFFDLLLNDYDINPQAAIDAAIAYADDPTANHWRTLRSSTEARRMELLRRLNRVPGAAGKLVHLRAKLLTLLKDNPELRRVDIDFEHLFTSWFNRGFLVMRQIDWNTPASVLEKIIQYEAVHAINDWADLRSRLEPDDRRCFAFFHPAMPDDPLIFVEVALTRSLPESIQSVLEMGRDPLTAVEADTAVFYSISNCQVGLKGVSFGNFLIKQVAEELSNDFPNLMNFRTLSPVPSLVQWFKELSEESDHYIGAQIALKLNQGGQAGNEKEVKKQLSELAANYLVNIRREDNQPRDPVARFHLGNGATLSEVIASADLSKKGLANSAGVMVSYLYDLEEVGANHEAYATNRIVATTRSVDNLLASG